MTGNIPIMAPSATKSDNRLLTGRPKDLKSSTNKNVFARHLEKARQNQTTQDKDGVNEEKPKDAASQNCPPGKAPAMDENQQPKADINQKSCQEPVEGGIEKDQLSPVTDITGDGGEVSTDLDTGMNNSNIIALLPTQDAEISNPKAAAADIQPNPDKGAANPNLLVISTEAAANTARQGKPTSSDSVVDLPVSGNGTGGQLPAGENNEDMGKQSSIKNVAEDKARQVAAALAKALGIWAEDGKTAAVTADKSAKNTGPDDLSFRMKTSSDISIAIDSKPSTAPTDVKKIIDLESYRLPTGNMNKASSGADENQTTAASENNLIKTGLLLNQANIEPLTKFKEVIADTAKPSQMPETKDIIDQIVKKTDLLVKLNSSEMKIHLKPEFLGKMIIKVMVDDGVVTARFITENQNVKQVLEANFNSLRQSLEANGMRVDKTEVSVQLYNDGNYSNSGGGQQSMWDQQDSNGYYGWGNEVYHEETAWSHSDDIMENEHLHDESGPLVSDDGKVDFVI